MELSMLDLLDLGFDSFFQRAFFDLSQPDLVPARVAVEHRDRYVLLAETGELEAELSGRFRHDATSREDLPVVGDWVAVRDSVIHRLLPRRTAFIRNAAGRAAEAQVVAANIDFVWLVSSLDRDFNLRRLERYLAVAQSSGAMPVIVLTKADLALEAEAFAGKARGISRDVHVISCVTRDGLDDLERYFTDGKTVALLGSSGAGKSTLVNALTGSEQSVKELGVDARGMHTTTHRHLLRVPSGGAIIDTPGMRELRLWDDEVALDTTFDEIGRFAERCRFRDCAHAGEPGCAVQRALEEGALDPSRWHSYVKLQREAASIARRKDARARTEAKRAIKIQARALRRR
jgi:ribosome biogenesis GTPase